MHRRIVTTLGLILCSVTIVDTCKAQTAAQVVFYHHRSTPSYSLHAKNFPLYPTDGDIPNLPKKISPEETDLTVIEDYYNRVSKAYFQCAEALEQQASGLVEKVKTQQGKVTLARIRHNEKPPMTRDIIASEYGLSGLDRPTERISTTGIKNNGSRYADTHNDAKIIREKAEFYVELRDTTAELKEGIMK